MSGFPSLFATDAPETDKSMEDPLDKKHHPDFITLQRVEHELGTFRGMKLSVLGMLAFVVAKIIIQVTDVSKNDPTRKTIDIILGSIELLGYALGLQAYSARSFFLTVVFQLFLIFSLGINVYYLVHDSDSEHWSLVAIESVQTVLTLIVMAILRRYIFLLRKRDQLKRGLKNIFEA
jgi:hypothetical protein